MPRPTPRPARPARPARPRPGRGTWVAWRRSAPPSRPPIGAPTPSPSASRGTRPARRRRGAPRRGAPAGEGERARRPPPPDRAYHVTDAGLVEALAEIVGARHVRSALPERLTYARDGLPTHRRVPRVAVLPGSRDEVVAVVRLLAALGIPFVPRGAGTGLSGGALADAAAVLLVLTRLNRILKIH